MAYGPRRHTGLAGATPAERSILLAQPIAKLESYTGDNIATTYFGALLPCNYLATALVQFSFKDAEWPKLAKEC